MELHMKMPDLATTGSDIRIVRWLAQPGQQVKRGQPLLEVETEKAVSQVESIATGVLKALRALPDSFVAVGQVIAVIESMGASHSSAQPILETSPPPAGLAAGARTQHEAAR